MAKAATKAVTTKENSAVATNDGDIFGEHAGAGMETMGVKDLLVPRLTILQDLSPQIKKTRPEFIEGAEIGQICDVGTNEIFPDGVLFLPVVYRKEYLEWAPRSTGKGLIDIHSDPAILDQTRQGEKRSELFLPNGNLIQETAQWFGLNLTASRRQCFIPMVSTQLKVSRRWGTVANSEKLRRGDGTEFTAPLFYRAYNLSTATDSNNDGEWFLWKVDRAMTSPDAAKLLDIDFAILKEEIFALSESLKSGNVRGDVGDLNGGSGADTGDASEAPM